MKNMGLSSYYIYIYSLLEKITGIPIPEIPSAKQEQIKYMFSCILIPFRKLKPKNRKSLIRYNYILLKFCEMLKLDYIIPYLPQLKCEKKKREQDDMWKLICDELRWDYISSF